MVAPDVPSLHVERITPPADVAAAYNLDPATDTRVIRRHVRAVDGQPAIVSDDDSDLKLIECTELAKPEGTTRPGHPQGS